MVGSSAGVHPGLHQAQRVDDARVTPRQLALQQVVVVLGPELLQQRLVREVRAGVRPVADPERHRRHVLPARLLRQLEERLRVELQVRRHGHAELAERLAVEEHLDRPRLERHAVRLALVRPRLLRPRLDRRPVERGEVEQEAVLHVLELVGLGVEEVRRGAGAERGLERGVERGLLVPGRFDLHARIRRLEPLDRVLDVVALDLLRGPVAPHRDLGLGGRVRGECERDSGEQQSYFSHDASFSQPSLRNP